MLVNDNDIEATATWRVTLPAFIRRASTLMFIVPIFVIGILTFIYLEGLRIVEHNTPLLAASLDMEVHLTKYHLWFEEYIQGDVSHTQESVWLNLEKARESNIAMLNGGQIHTGQFLSAVEDPIARSLVLQINSQMTEFSNAGLDRLKNRAFSLAGSESDQRFDQIFEGLSTDIQSIKTRILKLNNNELSRFKSLIVILGACTVLLILLAGGAFLRFERRQTSSDQALRQANEAMEITVKERTAELAGKIKELDFQKLALDEHSIVSVADVKGNITYVNDKFCKVSGYSREELMGQNHRMVKSTEHSPAFYKELWLTIANGKPWNGEIKNEKKAGGFYWVNATIVPTLNDHGKPTQYVSIRTDITAEKEASKAAKSANIAKSNFLSTMSHEIRTPLNGVLGLAQLLTSTDLNPDQRQKIDTILSSGQALLAILNDVLDMSKIEAGAIELESHPFSLAGLISTITTPFQNLSDEKGLRLIVKNEDVGSLVVKGDPVRLRQVLWNLLSNAIKFTDEGSVTLSIAEIDNTDDFVAEAKAHVLHFAVEDSGSGIAHDRVEAIFGAFTQEDSTITRKYGGTGLGLSIVKQLT